jgi:methylated-DNA-[protein]-cysteine S-methyltransferase
MTARLVCPSPLGPIAIEAVAEGVTAVLLGAARPADPGASALARGHLEAAEEALRDYFAGRPPRVPLLAAAGTPFQKAVWAALGDIPWGEVRTYQQLAEALGRGGCARAVGGANGANPIAILVPCHRVVQAGGRLGGYAGGVEVKRWLLAHEAGYRFSLTAQR